MAGYVLRGPSHALEPHLFHIDDPDVVGRISEASGGKKAVLMQLDGDELRAALWGLKYYSKTPLEHPPRLVDEHGHPIPITKTTIVGFRNSSKVIQHTINDVIPNVAVGQVFVYDHPKVEEAKAGRVTNIQHTVDVDGSLITYIDVAVEGSM